MMQQKSIEVRAQEWLRANGHDLTEANDIFAAEMRAYARQQVLAEDANPIASEKPQPHAKGAPYPRPVGKAKK